MGYPHYDYLVFNPHNARLLIQLSKIHLKMNIKTTENIWFHTQELQAITSNREHHA